ncbi:MAG: hypothetical protein WBG85_02155 [Rhodanobacter sp.]
MGRLQLAVLVLWLCPACIVAMASPAGQAPITSKAALTRYLHDTPPGTSPLDNLSPGGRKRFLAQLEFGPHGLRSLSLEDPANELTRSQTVQLLALFGAEKHAIGGLTPAEQARRHHERMLDAASRGCAVDACDESVVERLYDKFVLQAADTSTSPAEHAARTGERYDRLFGEAQAPEHVRLASHTDLRLLKRAAEAVVFNAPSATRIAQLRMDLAEMQRRGMASDQDYARLHQALVARRDFDAADRLAQAHPGMDVPVTPALRRGSPLPPGQPTALTMDARTGTMARLPFDLSAPLRIVVWRPATFRVTPRAQSMQMRSCAPSSPAARSGWPARTNPSTRSATGTASFRSCRSTSPGTTANGRCSTAGRCLPSTYSVTADWQRNSAVGMA